jgi:hypothetical protein
MSVRARRNHGEHGQGEDEPKEHRESLIADRKPHNQDDALEVSPTPRAGRKSLLR